MSDFFQPEIFTGPVTEYTIMGETFFIPSAYFLADIAEQHAAEVQHHECMTIGRLSAPGYLDCTDWTPYATPEDAEQALAEELAESEF